MIDKELLEILVCPENHTRLAEADAELLERVNALVRSGQLRNRSGRQVEQPLEAALVREDKQILYPIEQGIPVLLVDEGIPLDAVSLA